MAVCLLERAAEMYRKPEWAKDGAGNADGHLKVSRAAGRFLEQMETLLSWKMGRLHRTGVKTEAGMALELWSGFHLENKVYIQQFVNALGPCPEYRPNPNVGRTNMFIGMMIRLRCLPVWDEANS